MPYVPKLLSKEQQDLLWSRVQGNAAIPEGQKATEFDTLLRMGDEKLARLQMEKERAYQSTKSEGLPASIKAFYAGMMNQASRALRGGVERPFVMTAPIGGTVMLSKAAKELGGWGNLFNNPEAWPTIKRVYADTEREASKGIERRLVPEGWSRYVGEEANRLRPDVLMGQQVGQMVPNILEGQALGAAAAASRAPAPVIKTMVAVGNIHAMYSAEKGAFLQRYESWGVDPEILDKVASKYAAKAGIVEYPQEVLLRGPFAALKKFKKFSQVSGGVEKWLNKIVKTKLGKVGRELGITVGEAATEGLQSQMWNDAVREMYATMKAKNPNWEPPEKLEDAMENPLNSMAAAGVTTVGLRVLGKGARAVGLSREQVVANAAEEERRAAEGIIQEVEESRRAGTRGEPPLSKTIPTGVQANEADRAAFEKAGVPLTLDETIETLQHKETGTLQRIGKALGIAPTMQDGEAKTKATLIQDISVELKKRKGVVVEGPTVEQVPVMEEIEVPPTPFTTPAETGLRDELKLEQQKLKTGGVTYQPNTPYLRGKLFQAYQSLVDQIRLVAEAHLPSKAQYVWTKVRDDLNAKYQAALKKHNLTEGQVEANFPLEDAMAKIPKEVYDVRSSLGLVNEMESNPNWTQLDISDAQWQQLTEAYDSMLKEVEQYVPTFKDFANRQRLAEIKQTLDALKGGRKPQPAKRGQSRTGTRTSMRDQLALHPPVLNPVQSPESHIGRRDEGVVRSVMSNLLLEQGEAQTPEATEPTLPSAHSIESEIYDLRLAALSAALGEPTARRLIDHLYEQAGFGSVIRVAEAQPAPPPAPRTAAGPVSTDIYEAPGVQTGPSLTSPVFKVTFPNSQIPDTDVPTRSMNIVDLLQKNLTRDQYIRYMKEFRRVALMSARLSRDAANYEAAVQGKLDQNFNEESFTRPFKDPENAIPEAKELGLGATRPNKWSAWFWRHKDAQRRTSIPFLRLHQFFVEARHQRQHLVTRMMLAYNYTLKKIPEAAAWLKGQGEDLFGQIAQLTRMSEEPTNQQYLLEDLNDHLVKTKQEPIRVRDGQSILDAVATYFVKAQKLNVTPDVVIREAMRVGNDLDTIYQWFVMNGAIDSRRQLRSYFPLIWRGAQTWNENTPIEQHFQELRKSHKAFQTMSDREFDSLMDIVSTIKWSERHEIRPGATEAFYEKQRDADAQEMRDVRGFRQVWSPRAQLMYYAQKFGTRYYYRQGIPLIQGSLNRLEQIYAGRTDSTSTDEKAYYKEMLTDYLNDIVGIPDTSTQRARNKTVINADKWNSVPFLRRKAYMRSDYSLETMVDDALMATYAQALGLVRFTSMFDWTPNMNLTAVLGNLFQAGFASRYVGMKNFLKGMYTMAKEANENWGKPGTFSKEVMDMNLRGELPQVEVHATGNRIFRRMLEADLALWGRSDLANVFMTAFAGLHSWADLQAKADSAGGWKNLTLHDIAASLRDTKQMDVDTQRVWNESRKDGRKVPGSFEGGVDRPIYEVIQNLIQSGNIETAKKTYLQFLVYGSQWGYGPGKSAHYNRNVWKRMIFQFSQYPMNYLDYTAESWRKVAGNRDYRAISRWIATHVFSFLLAKAMIELFGVPEKLTKYIEPWQAAPRNIASGIIPSLATSLLKVVRGGMSAAVGDEGGQAELSTGLRELGWRNPEE